MRIASVCALLVALSPELAAAQPADFFRKGPYLQAPTGDGVTIAWEGRSARAAEVRVRGTDIAVRADPAVRQEVRVEGLTPGERYRYEVRAGDAVARGELQAAPPPGAPISFVVLGNTRLDARVQRLASARARLEDPDFVLGTGNLVSDGLSEHDWQRLFRIQRELLEGAPLFPVLGRHDLQGHKRSAESFQTHFVPPRGDARYYAFGYGPAKFVMLDSNARGEDLETQTRWLEDELKKARADGAIEHVFAVTHHAPFSVGLHGGDDKIRDAWVPLFEEYGVDAVLSGHDHVYSRAEQGGVRYFVTGGGGAPLYRRNRGADEASKEATRHFESVHHYLRVDVVAGVVEVSAIRLDGTMIETTVWGEARAPSDEVRAEVEAFLAPPEPTPANRAERPARAEPSAELPPRGTPDVGLGLGLVGLAFLVVGGGTLAWSLRRAPLR